MTNQLKHIAVALSLIFLVASCAVTDFDRSADFTSYRSFSWGPSEIKVSNPLYSSDLINKNIKQTVEKEFAKRGIVHNNQNADVVVSYKTYTEQKQQSFGSPYGYAPYGFFPYRFYPMGFGWGYPFWGGAERVKTVTEGTLVVDIKDRKTDQLVWRGSVEGNVEDIKNLQKQIQKGIKAILKKYPVTPDQPLQLPDNDVVS